MRSSVQRIIMAKQMKAGQWHVGYDSLLLFGLVVIFNSMLLFQYFQSPDVNQTQIWIAIFQLLPGLGGLMLGSLIAKDELDVSMSNKMRLEQTYVNGIMIAIGVMALDLMLGRVLGQTGFSYLMSSGALQIPGTAGLVEEAFFALGLGILLYKIFKEVFARSGMGELLAMIFASVFISVFFSMIHLWVYRTVMEALIILVVNRFIYTMVFLKYKNFSMLVIMHIFHNFIALIL